MLVDITKCYLHSRDLLTTITAQQRGIIMDYLLDRMTLRLLVVLSKILWGNVRLTLLLRCFELQIEITCKYFNKFQA